VVIALGTRPDLTIWDLGACLCCVGIDGPDCPEISNLESLGI
jgi:hypothetical protein